MCGILGAVGPGAARLDEPRCRAALACIAHRGPDAAGLWRGPGVVLGHRRLAIIDLDPRANQPMRRDRLTIVLNGEIYNFRDLRRDLERRGHVFTTTSDTEVLLAGILEHGIAFLDQVEGMFAFALWDERDHSLLLARDRFGEKPLFILNEHDRILFASEIAALEAMAEKPPEEDETAIGLYFRFSYIPAPFAPFVGASQLEPGTWLKIDSSLGMQVYRYYALPEARESKTDYASAAEQLRERLTRSVTERLAAADVPVATLLSGGIDSSIVTILAERTYGRPVRAYSLAFPEDPSFDESVYARIVAARLPRVEHRVVPARIGDLLDFSERMLHRLSEPLADASLVPTAYLLSHVEEKVVLAGDGADEIFAGYGAYPAIALSARLPRALKHVFRALPAPSNPHAIANPILRQLALFRAKLDLDPLAEYLNWRTYADPGDLERLKLDLSGERKLAGRLTVAASGRLRDVQCVDIAFNLPNDMLRKVDIATMLFGIEGRLPYLDSKLVRFALELPDDFRVKGRVRKRILRDAFAQDLPPEVLKRGKMGFLMPIRSWFKAGPLHELLLELVAHQTRFDPHPIHEALAEHAAGRADRSVLLWSLLVYLRWREQRAQRVACAA
jgi:asparagine synthase (glutamine-hydrolysing)